MPDHDFVFLSTRRCGAVPALAALLTLATLPVVARAQVAAAADSVRTITLDDAFHLAEASSPDIAIASAGITRAQGQQKKARSQYFPQLYGSASYTRTLRSQFQGLGTSDTTSGPAQCSSFVPDTTLPLADRVRLLEHALGCSGGQNIFGDFSQVGFGAANQYNLGLSLTENLFAGGRIRAQNRQAAAGRASADIGLTAAHAQLLLDVTQAYYDAILSDRLVTIAEATLSQADTTLAQTRLARQVGNQPEFDLLRAQVTRDNQEPVVIQRRADRDLAYLRLKQRLNVPLDARLDLTTSLDDTTSAPSARLASLFTSAPDTVTADRAPVRQAAQNLIAQQNAVTVARAQRIPTLTLSSAYGRVAFPPNGLPDWGQFRTNWTITGAIQVPLFTGGSIRGDELVAEGNAREAEARLKQTRDMAGIESRDAYARLNAARAQYAASTGTVEQAVKAYSIAEVRYHEGISTQTELSDSRILLQQAQANRAQASRDLQVARVRVALLRDLPLASSTLTPSAAASPSVVQPAPATPAPQPQTQTQTGGVVNASQSGVTP
ncbi:MAG TPA: TolC family protein [Gemmatimonadaceae bacterium]|nr:TolC family protein [Gemmatimonadaceae bacterium]